MAKHTSGAGGSEKSVPKVFPVEPAAIPNGETLSPLGEPVDLTARAAAPDPDPDVAAFSGASADAAAPGPAAPKATVESPAATVGDTPTAVAPASEIALEPAGVADAAGEIEGEQRPAAEAGRPASLPTADEITAFAKVGDKDGAGREITQIFTATRRFVIYEADGQVRYQLPESHELGRKLRSTILDIGVLRSSIEHLRAHESIKPPEKERAARELAWAMATSFEDVDATVRSEVPKQVLTGVDARLRSLVLSHHRKYYAIWSLGAFVAIELFLVVAILLLPLALVLIERYVGWQFQLSENKTAQAQSPFDWSTIYPYAIYAVFGGLGAFLSVISSLRAVDIGFDLRRWEYGFAGAGRILIGVIGAIVVGLVLDSNLVNLSLGTVGNEGNTGGQGTGGRTLPLPLYFILCFIAGFSERLVPNLLRRGEDAVNGAVRVDSPPVPPTEQRKNG